MNALKRGKAEGKTKLLPEILLYRGAELHDTQPPPGHARCVKVGNIVDEWKNAVIVPIRRGI